MPVVFAAEGDLDPTWGGNGKVITGFPGGSDDYGFAMTLQGDGKVLMAGKSGADFALARYHTDGTLDTTFNGTGLLTTDFGSLETATCVAWQSDGKILLGGYTGFSSEIAFALARYNPDGSLDTSFNGTGKATFDLSQQEDKIAALAVQSDGKILAAGTSYLDLVVLRLNIDGSLDTTFNGSGKATSNNARGTSMALQPDGKIVVGGFGYVSSSNDFVAARFNPDGTRDTTFNGTGRVTTAVSLSDDRANSVALQDDGKILLAGVARDVNSGRDQFAVVRYFPNGSLDTSFGGTGKVTTAIGTTRDTATAMAVQNDGKILVSGSSYLAFNTDFALVRYNVDGSLDTSFHGDGKVTTPVSTSGDTATAMALQADGNILVGGDVRPGSNWDFAVVRYRGAAPVPEPASGLLAAGAGAFLLARRPRGKGRMGETSR